MAEAHLRPKKYLQFAKLLEVFQDAVEKIVDTRDQRKVEYSLKDFYTSAFAMFFLQDPSLLEFQRRCQESARKNNLSTVFGVENIPSDTQLRDVIDNHSVENLSDVFYEIFSYLQQEKHLDAYQFLDEHYLLPLDGSEYFSSTTINCEKCLRKKSKNGIRYHHQILQAALVHPDMKEVIPLAPEFIQNNDGNEKQDCELKAAGRLLDKIKLDHPHLKGIIVGDGLYSKSPFIKSLTEKNLSFILVAKPADHKSLYADIEGLRKGAMLERLEITEKKRTYIYEWTNHVYLHGSVMSQKVNFCQFTILKDGEQSYKNAWVTDIEITKENIIDLVRGGRARWKIENEGFNTLKNQGYHLEHNYGHGKKNLSDAFFLLNLLAFLFHQIFQLCDGQYQTARNQFSARKEFWNCIRSMFRFFIFDSWTQVLERINGPPQRI